MDPILRALLDQIAAGAYAEMSTDQLIEGQTAITEALTAWRGDRSLYAADEVRALVNAAQGVRAEVETRRGVDEALDAEVNAIVPQEAAVVEPAPVVPAVSVADAVARRPAAAAPVEPPAPIVEVGEPDSGVEVIAASGGPGSVVADDAPRIVGLDAIGQAMNDAWRGTARPANGKVLTRAIQRRWDASLRVDTDSSPATNFAAMGQASRNAQLSAHQALYDDGTPDVLQAATGICGPLEPRYNFLQLASATAGIINLTDVGVARGGLRIPQAVTYDDIRGQVAIAYPYTSQMGADGGVKPCWEIECPGISDFIVIAYQTCLRFGNFTGMFFPEYVEHISDLSMAAHAHDVNLALILGIVASADTVTYDSNGASKLGDAWVQFTRQATFHAWLYRNKYRTSEDLVLEQVWPHRALGALIAAVMARTSSEPTRYLLGEVLEAVAAFGRTIGVRFQFVYDWQEMTQAPNDFGAENYSFLQFPAGEVIHMTAETLDLGVVRDSTRNAANEFDTWVETFDGLAFSGYEIMNVTEVVLCPNGATGSTVTIECDTSGS